MVGVCACVRVRVCLFVRVGESSCRHVSTPLLIMEARHFLPHYYKWQVVQELRAQSQAGGGFDVDG